MKNQPGTTTFMTKNEKMMIFVTYAGSQLTYMTQHEKVMIFRDLGGVTTDLHDTA